jgi:uroporphyrinogen III methyltransferase/synthase
MLEERGAEAFLYSSIKTIPPVDWSPLDKSLETLSSYDGLIFTSVNGVRFFSQRLKEKNKDIRELKGVRIYAIGPKTEQAVRNLNIKVDTVPESYVAESLIESIGKENIEGKKFLLPRAAIAREVLPNTLREMGASIDVVHAYQTIRPESSESSFLNRLNEGSIDVVTFTSSSTVTNLLDRLNKEQREKLNKIIVACIGPITQKTAENYGLKVAIIPSQYTIVGLISAIETYFKK